MASQLIQTVLNSSYAASLAAIKLNQERLVILEKEEEDEHYMFTTGMLPNTSRIWKHPASSDWWEHILPHLPDRVFIDHFRVDRPTFNWLVQELKTELETEDNRFRNAVSVDRKVAAGLKCLGTTCDMLTIASLLGIGKSSAHKYFLQFVNAVYRNLAPKFIKFPTKDEIRSSALEFEDMWGFPMAFGAIDGTHIPFNPPTNLASDFYNYKGWSSVLAIAICDARGKAVWLKCGLPGRLSDSGGFKTTSCYARLADKSLIPDGRKEINHQQIPYVILGDSGFAMEDWLIKPFTHHGTMNENQKIFNYRHSRARRTVESMFGRIKMRWRRLLRGLDVQYDNAHKVITAAFTLHNISELSSIPINPTAEELIENANLEQQYPQPVSVSNAEEPSGLMYRTALMNYFCSQANPWIGS